MRYAVVSTAGEVIEGNVDGPIDQATIETVTGGRYKALEPDADSVFFINNDPYSGLAYNWLATHALQRRLHPQDRVTGDALVVGPVDFEGHPTDVTDAVIAHLREMAKR